MSMLPTLEGALVRAAAARQRRRWPRRVVVALAAGVAIGTAGVAAATSGLLDLGTDAPDQAPPAGAHIGALTAGSERLLDVTVSDPAGGPAWGLRAFRTEAGVTCLQPGRIQGGAMGIVGDDGRFHQQAPQVHSCQQGADADGLSGRAVLLAGGGSPIGVCAAQGSASSLPTCDAARLRTVFFGVLDGVPRLEVVLGAVRRAPESG